MALWYYYTDYFQPIYKMSIAALPSIVIHIYYFKMIIHLDALIKTIQNVTFD